MTTLVTLSQILVALGIINVWLLRPAQATPWRGGSARSLKEEFEVYGLGSTGMKVIGFLKITFAALLLLGIAVPSLTKPAALAIAALMLGAVVMHVRVGDPLMKSLPALSMLALAVVAATGA